MAHTPLPTPPQPVTPSQRDGLDWLQKAQLGAIGTACVIGSLVAGLALMWALKALSGAGQLSGRYQAPFNVGSVIFSANHGYTFAAYGGTPDGGTYTVKGDTLTLDPTSGQAATAGEANDPLYQAMAASLTTTLSADHNSFALGGVTYIKQ